MSDLPPTDIVPAAPAQKPWRATWRAHLVPLAPILLSLLVAVAVYAYGRRHPFLGDHAGHGAGGSAVLRAGDAAPGFSLEGESRQRVSLAQLTADGPAVVVFYKGYSCSGCVRHLREMSARYGEFASLGARVAAISPDPPALSAARIEEHGGFSFPLLSDPMRIVATRYGVYQGDDRDFHGLFVVAKSGKTQLAHVGEHPFEDVEAVLKAVRAAR